MRRHWATRDIDVPGAVVWDLFTDPGQWPRWGPSVRHAETTSNRSIALGTTGVIVTAVGLRLPFEITEFEDGRRWSWQVGGMTATDHFVEPLAPSRCRAGFGVAWPATPYLAVCRVALRRIEELAVSDSAA